MMWIRAAGVFHLVNAFLPVRWCAVIAEIAAIDQGQLPFAAFYPSREIYNDAERQKFAI